MTLATASAKCRRHPPGAALSPGAPVRFRAVALAHRAKRGRHNGLAARAAFFVCQTVFDINRLASSGARRNGPVGKVFLGGSYVQNRHSARNYG